jgi:hypothetical protein
MRTWTWANLLRCPPRERAPSQTAPRTPLIDAAAAGLIAHPAKDSERSGPAPSPSAGPRLAGQRRRPAVPPAAAIRPAAAAPPARRVPDPGPVPPPHGCRRSARSPRAPAMPSWPASTPLPGRGLRSVCGDRGAGAAGRVRVPRWNRPRSPTWWPGWASCPPTPMRCSPSGCRRGRIDGKAGAPLVTVTCSAIIASTSTLVTSAVQRPGRMIFASACTAASERPTGQPNAHPEKA